MLRILHLIHVWVGYVYSNTYHSSHAYTSTEVWEFMQLLTNTRDFRLIEDGLLDLSTPRPRTWTTKDERLCRPARGLCQLK